MDRAVDATAAEQARVRRVDDRVDIEVGDIGLDDYNACGWRLHIVQYTLSWSYDLPAHRRADRRRHLAQRRLADLSRARRPVERPRARRAVGCVGARDSARRGVRVLLE